MRKHLPRTEKGGQRILLMDGTLGEVGVDIEEYRVWRASSQAHDVMLTIRK